MITLEKWHLNQTGVSLKIWFIVLWIATLLSFFAFIGMRSGDKEDEDLLKVERVSFIVFIVLLIGSIGYTIFLFFTGALGAMFELWVLRTKYFYYLVATTKPH